MSDIVDVEAKEVNTSVVTQENREIPTVKEPDLPPGLVFATTRKGENQQPLLVVTDDGQFIWDKNAEERLDLDDFDNMRSIRYILKALWSVKKPQENEQS